MRAFVDKFEGKQAVLLLGENEEVQVVLPKAWLPRGIKEGTVLRLDFTTDEDATRKANTEVQALYEELGNEP